MTRRVEKERLIFVADVRNAAVIQEPPDLGRRETGPKITGVLLRPASRPARLVQKLVPDEQRSTERAAGVSSRGLDPDALEGAFPLEPAIGDAIQRDAAGKHQVLHAGLRVNIASHPKNRFFGDRLNARCEIHVPLIQIRVGLSWRSSEQLMKSLARHRQALTVVEVLHVEPQTAVGLQIDEMLQDLVAIHGTAVRGKPHQLVFAAVDLESAIVGERRVEKPE